MELCSYGCGREAKFQLKNGKYCCESSQQKCPKIREKNSTSQKISYKLPRINGATIKTNCKFCKKVVSIASIKKHEASCFLNPINLKLCPVCKSPIKYYKQNKTCSNKCARYLFSDMYAEFGKNNGGKRNYRSICFENHDKKCIICGEDKIVAVHHFDENNNNNDPKNLIPLCPTHHFYFHSKYRYLIIDKIKEFINSFIL